MINNPSQVQMTNEASDAIIVRRFQRTLVTGFLLAIAMPLILTGLGLGDDLSLTENRKLATFPTLGTSINSWARFPLRFRDYFNDNFTLRTSMTRIHAVVSAEYLGLSPTNLGLIGKDQWLFLDRFERAMEQHRNTKPFSEHELEGWKHTLERRRDWLKEHGIKYIFFVAPSKESIYGEYLPTAYRPVNENSRMEQLYVHLKSSSDIEILDLRPQLMESKQRTRLYHKTDTHWNDAGAILAFKEIVDSIANNFPQMNCSIQFEWKSELQSGFSGDLARMMGLAGRMTEPVTLIAPDDSRKVSLEQISREGVPPNTPETDFTMKCESANGPRVVVLRDSFFNAIEPFFSRQFPEVTYLWSEKLDYEQILINRPDIVIQEIVERKLMKPIIQDQLNGRN